MEPISTCIATTVAGAIAIMQAFVTILQAVKWVIVKIYTLFFRKSGLADSSASTSSDRTVTDETPSE